MDGFRQFDLLTGQEVGGTMTSSNRGSRGKRSPSTHFLNQQNCEKLFSESMSRSAGVKGEGVTCFETL